MNFSFPHRLRYGLQRRGVGERERERRTEPSIQFPEVIIHTDIKDCRRRRGGRARSGQKSLGTMIAQSVRLRLMLGGLQLQRIGLWLNPNMRLEMGGDGDAAAQKRQCSGGRTDVLSPMQPVEKTATPSSLQPNATAATSTFKRFRSERGAHATSRKVASTEFSCTRGRKPFHSFRNGSTGGKEQRRGEERPEWRGVLKLRNDTLVRSSLQIGSELCRPRASRAGHSDECDPRALQKVDDGGHRGRVFPSFRHEFAARKVIRETIDVIYPKGLSTPLRNQEGTAAGHFPSRRIDPQVRCAFDQNVGVRLLGLCRLCDQRRGERGQQHQQQSGKFWIVSRWSGASHCQDKPALHRQQNNNNNNNNGNNNNNDNVNAANSNTNQANMNTVTAGRRRQLAHAQYSARGERVRRILSQHHRAAHSKRDVGGRAGLSESEKCVNFGNSFRAVMGFLVRTNGLSLDGKGHVADGSGRSHAKYIFSPPDKALRKKRADSLDMISELEWSLSRKRRSDDYDSGDCYETGMASMLKAEVLNQTTVAALAYLDFFLANVAGDHV